MVIELNGEARELAEGTTVAALITDVASSRGSAAAVDGEVVPRSRWADFRLRDGQVMELITAVQGG